MGWGCGGCGLASWWPIHSLCVSAMCICPPRRAGIWVIVTTLFLSLGQSQHTVGAQ